MAQPLEATVLGLNVCSVPSLVAPGCSHRRPPAPTGPSHGNRCHREAPCLTIQPVTPGRLSSLTTPDPDVSRRQPSRSWEEWDFLHGPPGPATPPTQLPWATGTGQGQVAQEPHDPSQGRVWPPPTERQGWTDPTSSRTRPGFEWLAWMPSDGRKPAGRWDPAPGTPSTPRACRSCVLTGHCLRHQAGPP